MNKGRNNERNEKNRIKKSNGNEKMEENIQEMHKRK